MATKKKAPKKVAKASTKKVVQQPTTRELMNKATSLEQLEAIKGWSGDADLENLMDVRISAILEEEYNAIKKKVKPNVDRFEKAKKTLLDFGKKAEKLTMTINIPVTVTLDVTNLDSDSLITDAIEGWGYSLEDIEWDADAKIGTLDLTARQMELLNNVGAIADIEDCINNSLQGACSQVFEFFTPTKSSKKLTFEQQVQAMYSALEIERDGVKDVIDEFYVLLDKARSMSVLNRFYEPYPQLEDFLTT